MTKAVRWSQGELDAFQKRRSQAAPEKPVAAPQIKPKPKRSKYAAEKVEQAGVKFDSKKEARRWAELEMRAKAGEITDLQRQVKFELIPPQTRDDGKAERACAYIADFVYVQNGKRVVADAKGMKTKDYIIKRKLMLMVHGITVREV